MAPTMQVACKAFIAPNSAARSPKERYTHVPHSPRRHARCFLVECPTRGDGQDWDGSYLLELLLNATSLSPLATAKAPLCPQKQTVVIIASMSNKCHALHTSRR